MLKQCLEIKAKGYCMHVFLVKVVFPHCCFHLLLDLHTRALFLLCVLVCPLRPWPCVSAAYLQLIFALIVLQTFGSFKTHRTWNIDLGIDYIYRPLTLSVGWFFAYCAGWRCILCRTGL